jgi:hypothetical protein
VIHPGPLPCPYNQVAAHFAEHGATVILSPQFRARQIEWARSPENLAGLAA